MASSKPPKRPSKRTDLEAWLAGHRPERIGPAEVQQIAQALAPISESHLRKLVRECGVPLDPLVEGVRQDSMEALHRTLVALAHEYGEGDVLRKLECRQAVLTAKDHARWAIRRAREDSVRHAKEEMAEWMLVWLENPGVFEQWARIRTAARG